MNINDILTDQNRIFQGMQNTPQVSEEGANVRLSAADLLLSDLKTGDSLQAMVVSKDGNVVTLKLPGDALVDAKISNGMNLDIGKLLTFEVKSSSNGLMLSPLFTNMATNPNAEKALNMAGLPVNRDTVEMTREMMKAGMNVDRNTLSGVFKDVSMNPGSPISDIVDLHRLGIEVNENNLTQIENYKNLSYQLGEGMNGVHNDLGNVLEDTALKGNFEQAAKLLEGLMDLASEIKEPDVKDGFTLASENAPVLTEESLKNADSLKNSDPAVTILTAEDNNAGAITEEENLSVAEKAIRLLSQVSREDSSEKQVSTVNPQENVSQTENNEKNVSQKPLPIDDNTRQELANEISKFIPDKDLSGKSFSELFDITKNLLSQALNAHDKDMLSKLSGNKTILGSVLGAINEQWSITPPDVADKDKIMELYSRLNRQLGLVKEALENAGLKNSPAGESAGNMSGNLDFLNQVNQMYSYIQLPIRLSGGDSAHGDLYVYSNGKKLNMKDGKVSALLHLDMEHLGPVDVYVSMDTSTLNKKVNTQFYVADDSILDFLEEHMDELTERLSAKGYSVAAKTSVKGSKEAEENPFSSAADGGGINGILSQTGGIKLSEYSFDVRT